jgi:hypothetical protein
VLGGLAVLATGSWVVAFAVRDEEPLSKPEYEQKVRSVYGDVQTSFRRTGDASGTELADRVADAQDTLREGADELGSVEPPPTVASLNDQLVEGLRKYADDLDVLRAAIERQDSAAIERFNAGVAQRDSVRQIAAAAEEMLERGYDVGPIAEE